MREWKRPIGTTSAHRGARRGSPKSPASRRDHRPLPRSGAGPGEWPGPAVHGRGPGTGRMVDLGFDLKQRLRTLPYLRPGRALSGRGYHRGSTRRVQFTGDQAGSRRPSARAGIPIVLLTTTVRPGRCSRIILAASTSRTPRLSPLRYFGRGVGHNEEMTSSAARGWA